jgi:cardiolipin synthase
MIRLVMLAYVPQRRTPAAARSWLLLIFLFPWPGLLLYALIGRPFVPRRRIELQEKVSALIRAAAEVLPRAPSSITELPAPWSQVGTLASKLTFFRVRSGNKIELLENYHESIDRLCQDINSASQHVHLLYYIFADDRVGQQVEAAVVAAAARGVVCRVLMDGRGAKSALRTLAPRLRRAGIETIALLPYGLFRRNAARFDLRNHRKIAVIDGKVGYVGSQNIVDPDFKKGLLYEELVARVSGPVVAQLQAVLLADRYAETSEAPSLRELFPDVPPVGESSALAVPSGPSYPYPNNLELMISLIGTARQRVVITSPYFIPSDPLIQAMQIAVLRGVEVHLVACKQIDQALVGMAQRSYYEQLLESGVRIHLYRKCFLHAKHLTFDDSVALIGSSNMDIRSFSLNEEISLLIHDPALVMELAKIQQRYFADSDELKLQQWRSRPASVRILQNMARLTDSLL